jgi:hypothetical protein
MQGKAEVDQKDSEAELMALLFLALSGGMFRCRPGPGITHRYL